MSAPPPSPPNPDWAELAPHWDPHGRNRTDDAAAERELSGIESTASRVAGGGIRAAVLGVNDGLVTNLCLILGMAGAAADPGTVRLSGLASLFAGALSMAAGEWVSVRSQLEVAEGMERSLHRAWHLSPPLVLARMSHRMQTKGVDPATAERASEGVAEGRDAIRTSARVLFGVSPDDVGSPVTAAVSSLMLFALGAFVPLLPWFWAEGAAAVAGSAALTGAASLAVGAVLGYGSGRTAAWTALRQLLIVALASAVTYGLGSVTGTAVS